MAVSDSNLIESYSELIAISTCSFHSPNREESIKPFSSTPWKTFSLDCLLDVTCCHVDCESWESQRFKIGFRRGWRESGRWKRNGGIGLKVRKRISESEGRQEGYCFCKDWKTDRNQQHGTRHRLQIYLVRVSL